MCQPDPTDKSTFLPEIPTEFEIPWPILPETPTQLLKPGIGRVGLRVLPARTATLPLGTFPIGWYYPSRIDVSVLTSNF
jgi:hypothetical protein